MSTNTILRTGHLVVHEALDPASGEVMLRMEGPLDADAAPGVAESLAQRLQLGQCHLHLDMAKVSFISSSGIGSLIASIGEYRDEGGDIVLHSIPADLLQIFEMLGLLDYVTRVD